MPAPHAITFEDSFRGRLISSVAGMLILDAIDTLPSDAFGSPVDDGAGNLVVSVAYPRLGSGVVLTIDRAEHLIRSFSYEIQTALVTVTLLDHGNGAIVIGRP